MSESRRGLWEEKVRPKLAGRVSDSVMLLLGRAYNNGLLDKPLEEYSDAKLLSLPGVGPKVLAEIRRGLSRREAGLMREYIAHAIVIALSIAFLWHLIAIHKRVTIQEPSTVILVLEIAVLLSFIIFSTVSIIKLVRR